MSQGFRAPNLSELTHLDIARSGEIETAAPGLRPEQFITGEIGLKTHYHNLEAEFSYYYTDIEDMIVRAPTGKFIGGLAEVTKRNAGKGYLHGIELNARYRFLPQWTLFGWLTWMEGKVDGFPTSAPVPQTEYLSRAMPLSGEIGVRWETENKKFWAEAITLMADKADKLSSGDLRDTQRIPPGGTPSYIVATLRAGWRINPHADLSVAVENILDKEYRVHGSGVNEPRRNFLVALTAKF
ncbi:MAG: TonB-dependent receptor [Verrucomicrobiae bacterium]|nr:TonB-dependent receptor [Verrucomicrobiae bacterium]